MMRQSNGCGAEHWQYRQVAKWRIVTKIKIYNVHFEIACSLHHSQLNRPCQRLDHFAQSTNGGYVHSYSWFAIIRFFVHFEQNASIKKYYLFYCLDSVLYVEWWWWWAKVIWQKKMKNRKSKNLTQQRRIFYIAIDTSMRSKPLFKFFECKNR